MQKENQTFREAPYGYRPPYSSSFYYTRDRTGIDPGLLPKSVVVLPLYAGDTKGSDSWSWAQVERAESVLEAWRYDSIENYVYGVASTPGAPEFTQLNFSEEDVDDLDGAAFDDAHFIYAFYHGKDVSWRIQPLEDDWIYLNTAFEVWVSYGSHWSDCYKEHRHHTFICDGFRGLSDAVAHIRSLPYGKASKRIPYTKND